MWFIILENGERYTSDDYVVYSQMLRFLEKQGKKIKHYGYREDLE